MKRTTFALLALALLTLLVTACGPTGLTLGGPKATATATAAPTRVAEPTRTTPKPTTVGCPVVLGEFADVANAIAKGHPELGCPKYQFVTKGNWAEMPFERGHLFWSQEYDQFFVVEDSKGKWEHVWAYESPWKQGMPEKAQCSNTIPARPSSTVHEPVRGFGGVWCSMRLWDRLGWGTDMERGFNGPDIALRFEKGYIFRDSDGMTNRRIYILLDNGVMSRVSY